MSHGWMKLAAAFAVCAGGTFLATYAWQERGAGPRRPSPGPLDALAGWLRLMPDQVERLAGVDPGFAAERAALEAALATERERLAEVFERGAAPDDEILKQVERVIDARAALERRVAGYLVALRPHLTEEQRATLYRRCAEGVREAGGHRWRHGPGRDALQEEPGAPRGRGGRRGQGPGGPPWRDATDEPAGAGPQ